MDEKLDKIFESKQDTGITVLRKRFRDLPPVARAKVTKSKINDFEIFAFVKIGGQTDIDIFSKRLQEGLATNLHQGTLGEGQFFFVRSLVLASAVSPVTDSDIEDAIQLEYIDLDPRIRNAKFIFGHGKEVFHDEAGLGLFQQNRSDLEVGEYILENPRWLTEQHDIKFELKDLPKLPEETWVKLRLKGMITSGNKLEK